MKELKTERLLLRAFKELDYDDLFEYLSQLENDEFEGYPGITYENGREHLKYRSPVCMTHPLPGIFLPETNRWSRR